MSSITFIDLIEFRVLDNVAKRLLRDAASQSHV